MEIQIDRNGEKAVNGRVIKKEEENRVKKNVENLVKKNVEKDVKNQDVVNRDIIFSKI